MLIHKSNPVTKTGRMSATALLLCASVHFTPAAGAEFADALPAGAPLDGYFREARGGAFVPAEPTAIDRIRHRTDDLAHVSFDGEGVQPAGLTAGATTRVRGQARALVAQSRPVTGATSGLGAPVEAPLSDLLAGLHYAYGSDLGQSSERAHEGEREVLVRNSDAFVRAKVRLTLGKEWRGFVYADIGAADSALKWQGLGGISCGQGVDLLGGWRHVTYHFSPGQGFDSLDFNGPFLGATLAW
jgi:hypothetical protein